MYSGENHAVASAPSSSYSFWWSVSRVQKRNKLQHDQSKHHHYYCDVIHCKDLKY